MKTSALAELVPPHPAPGVAVQPTGSSLDIGVQYLSADGGLRAVLSIMIRPNHYRPISQTAPYRTYVFDIAPDQLEGVVAETFDANHLAPTHGHERLGDQVYRHRFPLAEWGRVSEALDPFN